MSGKFVSIVLISVREDITAFCRRLYGGTPAFRVENRPEPSLFSEPYIFIYDLSSFRNGCYLADELECMKYALEEHCESIVFLEPPDLLPSIKENVETCSGNILPFPVSEELFCEYVCRISARICDEGDSCVERMADIPVAESLFGCFGGTSDAIREVRRKIEMASGRDAPVLLLGETGTGKSTAAEIIHKLSGRKRKPFVPMNVSTISDALACSRLFGTESGAYTDAVKKEGLFKAADGGTLFLDEIGMSSPALQAMLLTVLESGQIQKVGSEKTERVDVRVIFATNASISAMMQSGSFRSDLYFRISDTVICIPPLRERKEDIRFMIEEYAAKNRKYIPETTVRRMEEYYWPGNIRELHQCLRRAFRNCPHDTIGAEYLDFGLFN